MTSDPILFSKQNSVATITLNRPEARNALSPDMIADLGQALRSCRSGEVRAVLLKGSGGAFCSGGDVKDFTNKLEEGGPDAISQHLRDLAGTLHREVILEIRRLAKPVIAAIAGVAAGGGFSLMLACDVRIAASNSRFLMAYANIGAPGDGGSTFLLPRLVGAGKAMDLYLASQPLSAEAALEIGLISQVVPAEELDRHALETATRLAQGPTLAYGRFKALMDRSWTNDLEAQLEAETEGMADIARTSDFHEGIRAFTDKRRPWFQGR